VDCSYYGREKDKDKMSQMSMRAIELIFTQFVKREMKTCKNQHVVKIAFEKDPHRNILDFSHTPEFIKMGERSARKALKKIRM
jgi:hypothetical protein